MPEVQTLATRRCRLRRERFHLSGISHLAEGHSQGGLHRFQSVQMADGTLRLHYDVVSFKEVFDLLVDIQDFLAYF